MYFVDQQSIRDWMNGFPWTDWTDQRFSFQKKRTARNRRESGAASGSGSRPCSPERELVNGTPGRPSKSIIGRKRKVNAVDSKLQDNEVHMLSLDVNQWWGHTPCVNSINVGKCILQVVPLPMNQQTDQTTPHIHPPIHLSIHPSIHIHYAHQLTLPASMLWVIPLMTLYSHRMPKFGV